ncbi:hypothetical protein Anapl_06635 [Anas platyrhynchos]|uniref:Uncharacterized protein n=1 Tax=Anas platyrhynchos TaxID=8839 RepID=R0JEV8_ANAPL|nr:hypothetical protein Anapl_06635 [Anas platyrhynchos]
MPAGTAELCQLGTGLGDPHTVMPRAGGCRSPGVRHQQLEPRTASLTGETGGCCLGQPRHYKQNELHGHQACPEGSVQPGHPWSCSNSALHPGSPCVGFVPTERGAQARSLTCVQKAGAWPEGGGLVQHNHH